MRLHNITVFLLLISSALVLHAEDTSLKFHGSTALGKWIKPFHDEIEKATGTKFELLGVGNGRGLLDLEEHRADAAMLGGRLKDGIALLNKTNKTSITGDKFVEHVVYKIPMKFVVQQDNPVKEITLEQGVQILNGDIRNWNELGGPDLKIVVLATIPTGGARVTYTADLLQKKPLALTARIVRNGELLVVDLGKTPAGFTLTDVSIKGLPLKALKCDAPLFQSFGIVTLGKPDAALAALIQEITKKLNPQ